MATVTLTGAEFAPVVSQQGVVVVDCWAPWCGPCKMFGPVFEETAGKYPQHVFAKLNTDDERHAAQELQIQSIPTLLIFRDGILLFRQSGVMAGPALEQAIGQVEALDMDDVRQQLEEEQAKAAPGAEPPPAGN